ncbi:hypothetical protein [Sphingomonas quercus]|uniref:Flap endonuclease-1-like 5' DNA nuclease n=1 Tax=Sphingomonas quercus TaxID=2842451 RepID=A0ABS6BL56_9SPHN|nr:hypothetical protein [Sphingomonas quercus]MBU3079023.1 hypothetical protein [Sphingomonas quercus]
MLTFTTNQLVILGLTLILGWLLGLASRSGGAKWRREAERDRERAEQAEARVAAANARIAELERSAHPIGPGTAAAVGAAARGGRDDLALIHGVGIERETRLNEAGYLRYRQIAELSDREVVQLEGRMGLDPGTIDREQWRAQAAALARGGTDKPAFSWTGNPTV